MKQRILITSALPYANGSLHLGHMLETIQTDIFVRFLKMQGNETYYICANDAHGTAAMIKAMEEKVEVEDLVNRFHQEHQKDFSDFLINFDNFYTTHSEENQQLSNTIFLRLKKAGLIETKVVENAYDEQKQMFLPDRFIKGACPKCKAPDQYGDNCEVCSATYNAKELIEPYSLLSHSQISFKPTEHLFFKLKDLQGFLEQFLENTPLQRSVANKLKEWFKQGLNNWDISRDAPYFGFEIPGHSGQYFYVWLDAPIGYMASFAHFCAQKPELNFDDFWQKGAESQTKLYHFIGKDITYFHCLFWPAMLQYSNHRVPSNVFAHGFLTVNGQKMSKSRGTFILARQFLEHFDAEVLRYYFATKLNAQVEDIDLNLWDLKQKINTDLVGKVVNIASRSGRLLDRYFQNQLADGLEDSGLLSSLQQIQVQVIKAYEAREFSQAMRLVMQMADETNTYLNDQKPWELVKNPSSSTQAHQTLSQAIHAFRLIVVCLKPVLPLLAQSCEKWLNLEEQNWSNNQSMLNGKKINTFNTMMTRIEDKQIDNLIEPTSNT